MLVNTNEYTIAQIDALSMEITGTELGKSRDKIAALNRFERLWNAAFAGKSHQRMKPQQVLDETPFEDAFSIVGSQKNAHAREFKGEEHMEDQKNATEEPISGSNEETPKEGEVAAPKATPGRLSEEDVIFTELEENPRREGSKGHQSFQILLDAGVGARITVGKFLEAGGRRNDLRWDIDKGNIKLASPEE